MILGLPVQENFLSLYDPPFNRHKTFIPLYATILNSLNQAIQLCYLKHRGVAQLAYDKTGRIVMRNVPFWVSLSAAYRWSICALVHVTRPIFSVNRIKLFLFLTSPRSSGSCHRRLVVCPLPFRDLPNSLTPAAFLRCSSRFSSQLTDHGLFSPPNHCIATPFCFGHNIGCFLTQ